MKDSQRKKQTSFTRRAAIMGGLKISLLSGLLARMYYLQIIEGGHYTLLSDDNRIQIEPILPERGHILDRYGRGLSINKNNYKILLQPSQLPYIEHTLQCLSTLIKKPTAEEIKVIVNHNRRSLNYLTIIENLTWDELVIVETHLSELTGITVEKGYTRYYPQGPITSHITGYIGKPSKTDPLFGHTHHPEFKIGKTGIEKYHDIVLRGTAGLKKIEVNALGRNVRELDHQDGEKGKNLHLSIHLDLQQAIYNKMQNTASSTIVMDVHTGEIYAMVSHASYDPNMFIEGLSHAEWEQLISDPNTPLKNKAIGGQYAPGSTFKMVVLLAALEEGLSTEKTYHCPGFHKVGNHIFHCWHRHGHGDVNAQKALTESCDIYFYNIATKIGVDKIAEAAHKFGLGDTLSIDLPGEKNGLIPTTEWYHQRYKKKWTLGHTINTSIGQGFVLTTPMQLATMTARLVNGGYAVRPTLLKNTSHTKQKFPKMDVKKQHLQYLIKSMSDVVNKPKGTAYKARILSPDFLMGGKTGTAQVRQISMLERKTGVIANEDLPMRKRDHALFVGFAPLQSPKFCIAIINEHAGGGSTGAAPHARDIMTLTQQYIT